MTTFWVAGEEVSFLDGKNRHLEAIVLDLPPGTDPEKWVNVLYENQSVLVPIERVFLRGVEIQEIERFEFKAQSPRPKMKQLTLFGV